jgi:hypothetical protein
VIYFALFIGTILAANWAIATFGLISEKLGWCSPS